MAAEDDLAHCLKLMAGTHLPPSRRDRGRGVPAFRHDELYTRPAFKAVHCARLKPAISAGAVTMKHRRGFDLTAPFYPSAYRDRVRPAI